MVTEEEFRRLLEDFDEKLVGYDEIWFYHNHSRFHKLYKRLLQETKSKIKIFTHIK